MDMVIDIPSDVEAVPIQVNMHGNMIVLYSSQYAIAIFYFM